jgi:hypothetical protein
MTVTAMWYYLELRKKGQPALHGRFDNNDAPETPAFWQDDTLAYRLASTVQKDINWGHKLRKTFNALADLSPPLTWKSFLFSMHATGEPQYVSVYHSDSKSGHAVIAYAVDVEKGELLIADPNYGGEPRLIPYENGSFLPYISAENLKDILLGRFTFYDVIRYSAKTALVPWNLVQSRWAQLYDGSVGDGRFPEYELEVRSNGGVNVRLKHGLETSQEKLAIDVGPAGSKLDVTVWRNDVKVTDTSKYVIPLAPGENELGVYVHQDVMDDGEEYKDEYVDFQWMYVTRTSETYEVEVEVQVHANIERVNQPDSDAGYEGQVMTHDTPFEKVAIRPTVRATRTGNIIAASWNDVYDAESDGTRTGWVELTFETDEKLETLIGFAASETLTLADGTVKRSHVDGDWGGAFKAMEDGSRVAEFSGPNVCKLLYKFENDWNFSSKNTRKVTGYDCDDYSVIRITIR